MSYPAGNSYHEAHAGRIIAQRHKESVLAFRTLRQGSG